MPPPEPATPIAAQKIFRFRREYNSWVADETMEDYALRYAPRSFRKETPDIKAWEPVFPLSYGAQVEVADQDGTWSLTLMQLAPTDDAPAQFVVPTAHLAPLGVLAEDPVAEELLAERFFCAHGDTAGKRGMRFGKDSAEVSKIHALEGKKCPHHRVAFSR